MYYQETLINGVLHYRTSPTAQWIPFSASQLSAKLSEAKGLLKSSTQQLDAVKRKAAEQNETIKDLTKSLSSASIQLELDRVLVLPIPVPVPVSHVSYFIG